ncbi:winged helix-turn-helix domain-containing protein [Streptomyces sp. NPDC000405]|uniref:winged helix-turn-helix domain-containing protein n=1 Tax=Streptomyces sp. NPDC000405 TaxID=3161033 RepID=UPI00398C9AE3
MTRYDGIRYAAALLGRLQEPLGFERAHDLRSLARASVWRLLTGRLGWSLQRPRRQALERDDAEIARWVAQEWPRIKKGR